MEFLRYIPEFNNFIFAVNKMFIDQPEILSTIYSINSFYYHDLSITVVLGILFIFSLGFYFLLIKSFWKIKDSNFFIAAIIIFWVPLYLGSLYNNFYDIYEIIPSQASDLEHKRIVRYCDIDHYEDMGGKLCGLFSFLAFSSNKLSQGTLVKIVAQKGTEPFIYYNYFPYFNYTYEFSKARYLLFYYSDQYFFENDILYRKNPADGQKEKIGEYALLAQFNPQAFILENKNSVE